MKRIELLQYALRGVEEEIRKTRREDYYIYESYKRDIEELGKKAYEIAKMIEEERSK